MKLLTKYFIIFSVGAVLYYFGEILWRGYSHPTMLLLGGICFLIIGLINELFPHKIPFLLQMLAGTAVITASELIAGIILNLKLHMNIWSYSDMPLNFMGQICLPYIIGWFFLTPACIVLDDYLRYFFFDGEKPHYKLI